MGITTAKMIAVERSITQRFDVGLRGASALYRDLCTVVPSDGEVENYGWIGGVTGMREFLGERQFDQLRAFDWTIKNKTWEQSQGLERHKVEDDTFGFFGPVAQQLGVQAARHPDELFIDLMVRARSTVCYDGQFFFDNDHAEGNSGTQSNIRNHPVVSASAVTPAEFKASFHKAVLEMMKFKNDKGQYYMPRVLTPAMMQDFHVVVPLALGEAASLAFMQQYIGQGGVAVDNVMLAQPRVHVVTGMGAEYSGVGSDVRWHLYYTGGMVNPYIFQMRQPLRREVKGSLSIEEKLIKLMTEARYNVGLGLWQYGFETTFTTI
jgi:phage major head subunit gpT-like protein